MKSANFSEYNVHEGVERPEGGLQPASYTDHFVEVDGSRLHYLDYGTAGRSPILCVHGGAAHGHWFDFFAPGFVPDFHVRALDFRGHGDSQWMNPPDYTYEVHAADLAAVAEKLDLRDFVLIGHSMGGLVSLVYTATYPGRIRALMPAFMGQGGITPGDGWTTGIQLAYNFTPKWQIEFTWNTLGLGNKFDNENLLRLSENAFWTGCDCNPSTPRLFNYAPDANGRAKGNQSQWLVNLNRNLWTNRRIVPYVGAGIGAMNWHNNPRVLATIQSSGNIAPGDNSVIMLAKSVPSETGFALDIKGGLKFYISRHWGLKTEMTNVTSFQDFHPHSLSLDTSGEFGTPGALFPISGRLSQSTKFNVTSGTGGVFFTF